MIPFNLEAAKKGKPVITRDGESATFITHLKGGQPAPLLFDITETDEHGNSSTNTENYYLNGRMELIHDHKFDLFMRDEVFLEEEDDEDWMVEWDEEDDD